MIDHPTALPDKPGVAIRAVNLKKSYGSAGSQVTALRGITFQVERGERIALLGKSGSGKSTLLNLLGGLDHPTAGTLEVAGHDITRLPSRQLAKFRCSTIGMIFQSFNLIASRTALQNVELPMVFRGVAPRQRRTEAQAALAAVGLGERLHHLPAQLSGGENQRVAVARSLVNHPDIILADEPTGNLDTATAHEVIELIMRHVDQHGATFILVTHDEELAANWTQRVLRLKDGQIQT